MDNISTIFSFLALIPVLLFTVFSLLVLKIFIGKSIKDPNYPPIDGTTFNQLFHFNKLYDYQTKVARNYPTFRLLAPDQSDIYTTDPRNIEHILKTRFDQYTKGEHNTDIFCDLFGQGIFAVDGQNWRQQRKLASFEFSTRVLRDFSCSVFRKNAAKLVNILADVTAGGQVFDGQDLLMRTALDSIFKVGFGVDLNCLDESSQEGSAFMKAFDEANALVYWRYVDPSWKLKRFLNIGSEASLRKSIGVINDFVHQIIRTKRTQSAQRAGDEKDDILSRFLSESEKDPEKMSDKYLRDIILNFMLAGKDTTGNTLSWFLHVLCKNPLLQEKVLDEIQRVVGEKEERPEEFVEKITDTVLDQMHYLHAALTETLRLYPAVPVNGRCTMEDDILPDGFKLKKGDGVYYVAYAMGRMQYIWGEDAEEFKPERWLKDGTFQPESPFKFIAFHAGPRICLGKDFAYRQMKILSIALLRFFRFRLADDTKAVKYKTMFTLHIDGGLFLRAFPRICPSYDHISS